MQSIADIYATTLHDQLKQYATWQPGTRVELGDYGELNGDIFSIRGNIVRDLQINLETWQARAIAFKFGLWEAQIKDLVRQ